MWCLPVDVGSTVDRCTLGLHCGYHSSYNRHKSMLLSLLIYDYLHAVQLQRLHGTDAIWRHIKHEFYHPHVVILSLLSVYCGYLMVPSVNMLSSLLRYWFVILGYTVNIQLTCLCLKLLVMGFSQSFRDRKLLEGLICTLQGMGFQDCQTTNQGFVVLSEPAISGIQYILVESLWMSWNEIINSYCIRTDHEKRWNKRRPFSNP